jgi:amino acid adenylation domain-containing protein
MTLAELLTTLARARVQIEARDGSLLLHGASGSLTDELRDEIRRHKPLLLARLAVASPPLPSPVGTAAQTTEYEPSFGQERLCFLQALHPRSAAYNVASALTFRGPLDQRLLTIAAQNIVDRHSALRTWFRSQEGRPVAVVEENFSVDVPVVDLRRLKGASKQEAYASLCQAFGSHAFALDRAALWRAQIVRLSSTKHAVVAAFHHSVADGWSLASALREVALVYADLLAGGNGAVLEPLAASYADYALWEREAVAGPFRERQLDYWNSQLDGFCQPLDLPSAAPRPAIFSEAGGRHAFSLDPALAEELRRLARSRGASLPVLFLAALGTLLHRYSRQERFLLGAAVSSRPLPQFRRVFGFFVNWLPMRMDFSADPPFDRVLDETLRTSIGAYEHRELPFDELVRSRQLPRDPSRHPLFQYMVVFHVPARDVRFPNLECRIAPFATGSAKLDLTLFVTDARGALPVSRGRDLFLEFEYSTDLFDHPAVARIGTSFVALLRSIVSEPGRRVASLRLQDRRDRPVSRKLRAGALRSSASTLHGLVEAQARATPTATALESADGRTTYAELDDLASSLAQGLQSLGVGPGSFVGVRVDRSAKLVALLLAVLKSGAAYVPLDPAYPLERVEFMARDSGASVVVGSGTANDAIASFKPVDLDALFADGAIGETTGSAARADLPAYLIYTSGSTGKPNGVLCSHRSVVRFVRWLNAWLKTGADDRVLFKTSISFDASVRELFAPLAAGARVVVAPPGLRADVEALARLTVEREITTLHAVPSLYAALLRTDGFQPLRLRHVVCGGEPMRPGLVGLHRRRSAATLHNVYGPTETTVDVTAWTADEAEIVGSVPIGRPVAGAQIYVLDAALELVPPGVIGEICVAGGPLALGYWRRPALTADRFVPDPFADRPGSRLYRTGDLGRYLPDGSIYFEGRADRQVKVRGQRIELPEVEDVLERHPGIAASAVVATHRDGDVMLTAFVEPVAAATDGGRAVSDGLWEAELRRHAARALPGWSVPSRFELVGALPVLPNTKIDRAALERVCAVAADDEPATAPSSTEDEIVEIFSSLLGAREVTRSDDFFALGGHSLLAAQLASSLRRRFDVPVAIRDIFENPTVAQLAVVVERQPKLARHEHRELRRAPRPS